jgi:ABC-type branched-subunit amino acid transport system ATPase component
LTLPLLEVDDLAVGYEGAVALSGLTLAVPAGGAVGVIGPNGAGKTTLLRAVTGLLREHGGRITRGEVRLDGERIDRLGAAEIVRRGVAQVMEGRHVFAELTVEENLRAGGFTRKGRGALASALAEAFDRFPFLAERRGEQAGLLSGGQQQLLAIARALMSAPRLLLLDEPSLGLAPAMVSETASVVARLHDAGTAVLVVEQQAGMALGVADEALVLTAGEVIRRGPAAELRDDPALAAMYLGGSPR